MQWFSLILFFVLLNFLWRGLSQEPRPIPSPLLGKTVPMMHAPKCAAGSLTSKHFLGHWSLLNVWASWCQVCIYEHATLVTLKKDARIILYGLNYRDDMHEARTWLIRHGNPYTQLFYDPKGIFALDLGVYGVPESFLIDPKGIIRYKQVGLITTEAWARKILPFVDGNQQESH